MVREFFERIAAPVRGLHQAAYLLAALTLAAQMLALLRDRSFTHVFGAGHELDLYYAAFRVPDLVFALVASLVSAYVLIPRLSGADQDSTKRILSHSTSFLLIFGSILCGLLAWRMPDFLRVLYPDLLSSPDAEQFVLMARILLIQPIVLGLSGVVSSLTQVHRRFMLFAISPVLYNLGIILGVLVLYPRFGFSGLAWGVVLGAVAHLFVHIPVLLEAGAFPRLLLPSWRIVLLLVRDSMPRSLALGMGSLTLLALTVLAARLGEGAVSVLTLAGNLEAVPLALIGASYAVAAFPALSEHAERNREEFGRILSASARHIVLWSLVFLGLIAVLRAHLVRVILGTGAFDWDATRLTAALLAILAAGLLAQGLVLLFSRALYAARDSWRPFAYQFAGCVVTIGLSAYLISMPSSGFPHSLAVLLRVGDVEGSGILLIALAATAGQFLLAVLCLRAVSSLVPGFAATLFRPFIAGCVAALLGGTAAYATLAYVGAIAPLTTLLVVFTDGFIAGMVGLSVSALALHLLKNEEFRDIVGALARLARPRSVLAPSAEEPAQP